MGSKALRKLQMGFESTKGTIVAATSIWRGTGMIDNQREIKPVKEDSGYALRVNRVYTPKLFAALDLPPVEATFEQIGYPLACGLSAVITGASDGSGSDKVYTYPFPGTSLNSIKTLTWEGGDDTQAEVAEDGFCTEMVFSGKGEGPVMMESKWACRQAAPQAFTSSLSLPTVEDMLFGKSKIYLDVIGGSWGTTNKANTLLEWKYTLKTGWEPTWTGDGNLYFQIPSYNKEMFDATMEVTFEHDGSATAEKAFYNANTARLLQIKVEGNAVTTPGSTYSKKTLLMNLAGVWTKFDKLDSHKGNDITKGTFQFGYDLTAAKSGQVILVNELTALP